MATARPAAGRPRSSHKRTGSNLNIIREDAAAMSDAIPITKSKSEPALEEISAAASSQGAKSPSLSSNTPGLSRSNSFSSNSQDEYDTAFPPLERLTVFDILENLALPQRLEKLQNTFSVQAEGLRRRQQQLKAGGLTAKERVVDEWRRRIPAPDEQLEKYKKRMRDSVDRLGSRWSDNKTISTREKVSFIGGVLNIFISGYLLGAFPQWFHYWYTFQLLYFMPIRYYTYHKRGYHYFLADLCYFVNLLLFLSIWVFPQSKRLFISTWCLAFGNNAVAIAMWRNSLVFHSLDKVTSLFIHIMPCATLHALVHLNSPDLQKAKFPAVYSIINSPPDSPQHYSLSAMMIWATVPYLVWQVSYHLLITVRRREKIAAGRPTSFTWLRRSYSKTWIGKFVLSLPESLQEPAFMGIQYIYAVLTMIPCPIWFWYRWASAVFLFVVFTWSIYNGATYYIDVFGRKFQNELEQLRKDVAKWQNTPGLEGAMTPSVESAVDQTSPSMGATESPERRSKRASGTFDHVDGGMESVSRDGDGKGHVRKSSVDRIPLLDQRTKSEGQTSGVETGVNGDVTQRK